MAEVQISYKGSAIAQMNASGTKTLLTEGKYLEDDVTVEYTRPSTPSPTLIAKTITQNGTYDAEDDNADGYSEVVVNVSGGGGLSFDEIVDKSLPTGAVKLSTAQTIAAYGIYGFSKITSLFSDTVKTISGNYAICYNPNLEYIVMANPSFNMTNINNTINNNVKLKAIDLASQTLGFGATTFRNNTLFNVLILRKSSVVQLSRYEAFNGTPFASNGSGGTLYVPQSLISSYQSATNWSTILGYANNSIVAIEGSQYENYYADGTPIPTT